MFESEMLFNVGEDQDADLDEVVGDNPHDVDVNPGDDDDDPEDEQQRQEHQFWLAGVLARHYERLGLIPESDQFDGEWHQEVDGEMEAVREQQASVETSEGDGAENGSDTSSDSGPDSDSAPETGSGPSGDFGSFSIDFPSSYEVVLASRGRSCDAPKSWKFASM